jgi:CRISPR-associated endonuclease/helicase Cas3
MSEAQPSNSLLLNEPSSRGPLVDYWAHPGEQLIDHLRRVGEKAAEFAGAFEAREQGLLAGQLHDLGKAEREFQLRVTSAGATGKKQSHALHGAALAAQSQSWPVALAVHGHHAGLPDRGRLEAIRAAYLPRANSCAARLTQRHSQWRLPMIPAPLPTWLARLPFDSQRQGEGWLAMEVFTRFLFSALVDADSLVSEEHERGHEPSVASRQWPRFQPEQWVAQLEAELKRRAEMARSRKTAAPTVQAVWQDIREASLSAAVEPPGLFSLAVPTGGGKTLAAVLFALAHSVFHNAQSRERLPFRRIIVVIPYLNIIRQTANELRSIFGENVILEDHSRAGISEAVHANQDSLGGNVAEMTRRRCLAAENWDAPLIVTTSVQFFESLFSRRRSVARKLHNICQSVVIFDEVQTLPPRLMPPLLSMIAELANPQRPYHCSMLFSTATQPALGQSDDLPCGLQDVRPIVPAATARRHFASLKRVEYAWPHDGQTLTWDELAQQIVKDMADRAPGLPQALIVVNTRQAARQAHAALRQRLGGDEIEGSNAALDGLFHLSTWMTPAHQDQVLAEVRRRLDGGHEDYRQLPRRLPQRCLLVSTQCIEAGVDVDFPAVWRAFGPYDSIAQVAGRCNRRGLRARGIVHIFRPADAGIPHGVYSTATAQTELLRRMGRADPHVPESFADYFRLLYQLTVPADCLIQKERAQLHFERVDQLFRFIDGDTVPVLVLNDRQNAAPAGLPTPAAAAYATARERGFLVREDWRTFQPQLIQLPASALDKPPFQRNMERCDFDLEGGLHVWRGAYRGGEGGFGISFDGLSLEDCLL